MVVGRKRFLFLILAVFLAILLILNPTKEKSKETLCQNLIEYLVNPQNYSLDQSVKETNEFYHAFSERYNCNFSFDTTHMMCISTVARKCRTVVTTLFVKNIRHETFQIEETQPLKYLSYTPQITFLIKTNYTYIDN